MPSNFNPQGKQAAWPVAPQQFFVAQTLQPPPSLRTSTTSETWTPSETFLKRVNKLLAEAVSLTEQFTATKVSMKAVADTVAFTEGFVKRVNNALAETVALTEARTLKVIKTRAETVGLTEGFAKKAFKNVGDTLGITELLRKFVTKRKAETVGLTENLGTSVITGVPPFIFKAQVVPVYVAADPTAPGVVPMAFVPYVPGVTMVHTVAVPVVGCVPMRATAFGIGVVPVMEFV